MIIFDYHILSNLDLQLYSQMYMNEIQHIDVEHNTSHHNIITIPFRLHFVASVNTSKWSKRGI